MLDLNHVLGRDPRLRGFSAVRIPTTLPHPMDLLLFSGLTPLAYLDPGTGAIIIQVLVGGVAGFFVFMKYQGSRIKGWFSRGEKPNEAEADADADNS